MTAAIASAAVALGRMSKPDTALAGVDGDVVLGAANNETTGTSIQKLGGSPATAFTVTNTTGNGIDVLSTTNVGLNAAGVSVGVFGSSGANNGIGISGQANGNAFSVALQGSSVPGFGVFGASQSGIGVIASSSGNHAMFGSAAGASTSGVFGTNTSATGIGVTGSNAAGLGVLARSGSKKGLFAASASSTAVVARSTTGKAAEFFGNVEITGDFTASGMKSAAVKTSDGQIRRMYCLESPTSYFEDIGSAQIVGGTANVALEPLFASTVDTSDYHVYLTAEGDCQGLYVSGKTASGFSVQELKGGTSTATFSYRIVAKRTGITNERLAPVRLSADPSNPQSTGPRPITQHVPEIPSFPTPPKGVTIDNR